MNANPIPSFLSLSGEVFDSLPTKKVLSTLHFSIIFSFLFFIPLINSVPNQNVFLGELQKKIPSWMNDQIENDFKPFQGRISSEMLDELYLSLGKDLILVRYKVIDNQLFSDHAFDWTGRSIHIENALRYFIETVGLPNLDCVVSMQDGIHTEEGNLSFFIKKIPLLAFAKSKKLEGIVLIPDFSALSDNYRFQFSYDLLNAFPWKNKKKKALWRGSTTGAWYSINNWFSFPRTQMTLLSIKRPDLIDAKFTNIIQCHQGVEEILSAHHLMGDSMSVEDQIKYRYLVDIDGNSCTYERCYWMLMSNSLLLKQVSDHIQWYYRGLVPNVHYVPLKEDVSDIFEKVKWAKKNDEKAKKIAKNATEFANKNLTIEKNYLHLYKVLMKYSEFVD